MKEIDNETLEEACKRIIQNAPLTTNSDLKMLYLYNELGKKLSKNVEFFYQDDIDRKKEMLDNYQTIEDNEVMCKSAVYLFQEQGKKLGLNLSVIEIGTDDEARVSHWALVYTSDNGKRYIINPIADFYRIQLGFSPKHFCTSEEYIEYQGVAFDSMSKEYIRSLNEQLGYLSGGMYTEELLEKLGGEIVNKLGTHIIRASDGYQDRYLKLLELIKNDKLSIDEKLKEWEKIDPNYLKNKEIIKKSLETKNINKKVKKVINGLALRELIGTGLNLEQEREGAKMIGTMDPITLKENVKDVMLYKFKYMMFSLPQITKRLTGYIENKNFIDEVKKYIFRGNDERSSIYRHTITKEVNDKTEYFMIISVKPDPEKDARLYCFYNPKTKEVDMGIEPIEFMQKHQYHPLKNSSLNKMIQEYNKKSGNSTAINRMLPTTQNNI